MPNEPKSPRHTFEDHTSEVRLRIQAPSLVELFEEAGRGLAALYAEVAHSAALGSEERVELEARDPAALLVAWLNELIFRSETRKLIYEDLHVDSVDDASLAATIRGREPICLRTAVKAATMHGVRVERVEGGFEAVIVLDV